MSWSRALAKGAVVVVAVFVLLFKVPDTILTELDAVSRSLREAVATVWFFGSLIALAWAFRRLQARHLI